MRLSKRQLEQLLRATRYPPGRAVGRELAGAGEVPEDVADPEERSHYPMENVIRATEEVARAADNVIRAAHDTAPAASAAPFAAGAFSRIDDAPADRGGPPPSREVAPIPPLVPRRRPRIASAVALLALAFGCGAGATWLVLGGASRVHEQANRLVSWRAETGTRVSHPAATDTSTPPLRRAEHAAASLPGDPSPTATSGPPPVQQPPAKGGASPQRTAAAEVAHPLPSLVPPAPALSAAGTAAAKLVTAAPATSAGMASGEPSVAIATLPPGPGWATLEPDSKGPVVRPAER